MGVELNIKDNLKSRSVNANHLLSSFDAQNNLLDKVLDDELYNQELYNGGLGTRYNGKGTELKDDFFSIINNSTDFDTSNINKLSNIDISNVSKSYNKVADMYRNQTAVTKYVNGKKNLFEKRNKRLLLDVNNKIREKEIYTYYYKKYNAQKSILLNIIFASALSIILIYLNKHFKFIFNDTLYVLAMGIIFAALVINVCIKLFDILFRNNINYDEYDFVFHGRSNKHIGDEDKKTKKSNCGAEIKAYEGRSVK